MFLERLGEISKSIAGTQALSLVDKDGIPIESLNKNPSIEIDVLAAELISQVRSLTDDYRELNAGSVRHLSVGSGDLTLMVSSVAQGYYLLLVLGADGNQGRARFELRRAILQLEHDLA